jgi:hypothetical protein
VQQGQSLPSFLDLDLILPQIRQRKQAFYSESLYKPTSSTSKSNQPIQSTRDSSSFSTSPMPFEVPPPLAMRDFDFQSIMDSSTTFASNDQLSQKSSPYEAEPASSGLSASADQEQRLSLLFESFAPSPVLSERASEDSNAFAQSLSAGFPYLQGADTAMASDPFSWSSMWTGTQEVQF